MNTVLEIKNAKISYRDTEIIHDLAVSIYQGELCALIGLNGSGKTTLLKGLCGLISADGTYVINGIDISKLGPHKRAAFISYMPQVLSNVSGKNSLEMVMMGANTHLNLLENPGVKVENEAFEILERFNIQNLANVPFNELSQGQKQLVILSRTVMQNTPLLVMDEPDSALDFSNKHIFLHAIKEIIKNDNKGGLITLHDPNIAMTYCDKLFFLQNGNIISRLNMHEATNEEICDSLKMIFGDVELVKANNNYVMVPISHEP